MLDTLTQTSNSVYARAIPPSQEGSLRSEQPQDTPQRPQIEAKRAQAEHLHEQKVEARREERRELASYRVHSETANFSPKHSQSQPSQLADKLLEAMRQSRQEEARLERKQASSEASNRRSQLDRTYHSGYVQQPRYIDEIA